ncbi:MAG: TetR/AcrR family transcriptional regulator [Actinomycetota bacterium]
MARKLTSQKRADLIAAATEVFKKKGFRDASVKDIVAEAGASTATFYRYFHTKDDIYEEIVTGFLSGFAAIWMQIYQSLVVPDLTSEQIFDGMAEAFRTILGFYRYNRDVAKVVFRRLVPIDEKFAEQGEMIVDAVVAQLSEILVKARQAGIARNVEPEVAASITIGGVFGVAIECVVEGERDDIDTIVGEFMEIVRHGLSRQA